MRSPLLLLAPLIACACLPLRAQDAALPPVTAACFAPDGRQAVVGSQAGLQVISWPELTAVRTLPTRLANIHHLSFSRAGDRLLAAGGAPAERGEVEIFAWPSCELKARFGDLQDVCYQAAWRGDGNAIAMASGDGVVQIRAPDDGQLLATLSGHSRGVLAVSFLHGGERLITASRDHSLRLWDAASGETLRTLDNHTGPVADLAVRPVASEAAAEAAQIAPQLTYAASIGGDRTLRLWQPAIGRLVRFVRLPSEPLAVAWTRSGDRVVVSCADGHVRAIDPDTVAVLSDVRVLEGWAYTLARSPMDDEFLVAGEKGEIQRLKLSSHAE